jgi:hypothetical protein
VTSFVQSKETARKQMKKNANSLRPAESMPATTQTRRKRLKTLSLIQERPRSTDPLFQKMRRLAVQEQKDAPQPFLSLRRAARQFKVPVSSMAAVYRRLGAEGILSSVRGARTILEGRNAIRTLKVRLLLGMPLSVPRLQTFQAYRDCFFHLREELQARGFLVASLYFAEREIPPEAVAERARQEKVDAVLWLRPDGIGHDTALRLRDLGIRFIGLNIGGAVGGFCRYEVRRRQAIDLILHEWCTGAKLTTAILVRAGAEMFGESERMARLREMAKREQMKFEIVNVPGARIIRTLQSLCAKKGSGILLAESAAALLGSRASDRVTEVLGSCRIALIDGPMEFPFVQEAVDGVVDLVLVDWERVGRRIAQDILSGEAFGHSETGGFEADARLQVPVGRCADASAEGK